MSKLLSFFCVTSPLLGPFGLWGEPSKAILPFFSTVRASFSSRPAFSTKASNRLRRCKSFSLVFFLSPWRLRGNLFALGKTQGTLARWHVEQGWVLSHFTFRSRQVPQLSDLALLGGPGGGVIEELFVAFVAMMVVLLADASVTGSGSCESMTDSRLPRSNGVILLISRQLETTGCSYKPKIRWLFDEVDVLGRKQAINCCDVSMNKHWSTSDVRLLSSSFDKHADVPVSSDSSQTLSSTAAMMQPRSTTSS